MDIPQAVQAVQESIDNVESQLGTAEEEAGNASGYAYEAKEAADNAETQADYCKGSIEEAQSSLNTLREEFDELVERIDEDNQGEESASGSGLQKDIARWKVKVLALHQRGAIPMQIAKKLEIGEFLVSRILELETAQAA